MPYQWNLDVDLVFAERRPQMVNRGLPDADVDAVHGRTTDMWTKGPGGWVDEWSRLAAQYIERGEMALALLAYGYAKFPVLADEGRSAAYRQQIEVLQSLAKAGPLPFERRSVECEHQNERVAVAVHQYSPPGADPASAPVLLASGGVDMWKEDLHAVWGACCAATGMSVLAFDVPGTGESTVPLSAEGAEIVSGLVREARGIGNGRVAHFGISMGGHFSARTGLLGEVDAAVVFGGPIEAAFAQGFGGASLGAMSGIVGSALGFDAPPPAEELSARFTRMSIGSLLEGNAHATPMLVLNGADDPLIPQQDTLVFQGRPGAEVHLIPDSGHCAAEKLGEVTPMIIGWLARTMAASG